MTKNKKRSFGALVGLFLFLNLFSVAHTNNLTELRANMGIALTVIHLPSSETSRNTLNTSEQTPYQHNLSKDGFIALQSEKKLPGQVLLSNSSVAQNQTSLSLSASAAVTITSTSLGTGDWSDGASWDSGTPSSTDDVVINSDITIDGNFTCQSLTIQNGASLTFGGGFSLTVNGNVLNSGTLTAISGSNLFVNGNLTNDATINGASNSNITVTGNWTNNNTYTANGGTVTFTSSGSTISGTTTFDNLDINAGSDVNSVISVTSDITVGNLLLENGLLQINGGTTTVTALNDPGTNPLHNTIPSSAGIEVTTGGTINTGDFTISNEGLIRVVDGIAYFGISAGNSIETQYDGAFIVDGGSVNIAGRLHNSASGTLPGTSITSGISMTGGMVTLSTIGNGLSNTGALNVTAAGNFNFSNGTIVIQNPNSTSGVDMDLQLLTGGGNKTIGNTATLQIGNGSTPPGSIFVITSQIDIPNLETSSNADIQLSSNLSITNSLTLSGKLQLNGNEIEVPVTNFLAQTIPLADNNGTPIPITVQLTGGNAGPGASITISTTESKHPNNKNTNNYLNRYWTINSNNITNPVFDILATYLNTEFSGSETDISSGVWTALPWVKGGTVNSGANTVSATGISEAAFEISGISTAPPAITINEGETASICDGSSIDLTTTSSGDPTLTYSWESDPVGFAATTEDVTDNPTANTSYTVTVTDGNGFTAFDQIDITIDPLPTAAISGDNTTCEGGSATISVALTGTQPWSITYTDGTTPVTQTGITSSPYTFSVTPTATTTYTLTDVSDANCTGTSLSGSATITVNPLPTAAISGDNTICEGGSATISVALTGTQPWSITYTDGTTPVTQTGITSSPYTFSVTPTATTTYTLTDASDANCPGASPSGSATITVNPAATLSGATLDSPVCEGSQAIINLSGLKPGTIFDLDYAIGGTPQTSIAGLIADASGNSSFTTTVLGASNNGQNLQITGITITSSTPSCTETFSKDVTLTVYTSPSFTACPSATISLNTTTTTCDAVGTYTVTAIGSPAPTFTYSFTGATTKSGSGTGSGETFSNGITNVTITATNSCGSTDCTFTVTVVDNVKPITPTLANITEQCAYTPASVPTTTDNCSGLITGTTTITFPFTTPGVTTIVWTFDDGNGNTTTANQVVTIDDTTSPTWVTFPATANIVCDDDTSPSNTGTPTATDNCSNATITYTDAITNGTCAGNYTITRTWKATDESARYVNRTQTINVTDTTPPVISCTNYTDFDPNVIPSSDLHTGVTATDNCSASGDILFELISEEYFGLDNTAGFCPSSLERVYAAIDACGNVSSTCTQTYTFIDDGSCDACIDDPSTSEDDVPFFPVIFSSPDETWTSPNVVRNGICCYAEGPPPPRCISFNVYLDEDAVGLVFTIPTGAIPGGALYYHIDCGPPQKVGDVICLAGGRFYTLTFCEPGNNPNTYSIQSISGAVTTEDLVTRADVQCAGTISVSGLVPSSVTWTVKYPNDQTLLDYLTLTDPMNPVFTPDATTPATIIYEVCGTLEGTYVCDGQPLTDCSEVTVTTLPAINISFDTELGDICEGDIPVINAGITPIDLNYTYEWHDGPDGTGTVVSTNPYWQPPGEGDFSLVVTENETGIGCNSAVHNFNITYDYIGPSVFAPPADLTIDCNAANAETLIQEWISTAYAQEEDGSTIPVTTDYAPFDHACGGTLTVTFSAKDQCNNISTATADIIIQDNDAPVITQQPQNGSTDCVSVDPDLDQGYLDWLAAHGGATATDQCDNNLLWTDNSATQNWVIDAINNTKTITIQFTVTDDCLNSVQTNEVTYTLTDDSPPTLTCPTGPFVYQAPLGDCDLLVNDPDLDPTYSDECSVPTLTFSMANPDGSTTTGTGSVDGQTFQVGITTVTYTVTDDVNNSVSCNFDVQVTDLNKPIFTYGCPTNPAPVNAEAGVCDAQVNIPVPDVSDPCNEGYTLVNDYNNTNDASDRYPVGTTIVTWTVTDASNNSETCQQTVIVIDNQPPTITCPGNVEDEITNNDCDLISDQIGEPTITENCSYTLTYVRTFEDGSSDNGTGSVSSLPFPVGLTTVEYTVTDGALQTAQCSFTVWIKNLVAPQFAVTCRTGSEQNITIPADPGVCEANVTVLPPIIDNPCNEVYGITNDFNNTDNASGIYPIGETTVTWTIEDASGNIYYCTQTVTVEDTQDPTITCQGNVEDEIIDGGCDLVSGLVTAPSVSDNCPNPVLTYELTFEDGSTTTGNGSAHLYPFPVGKTVIHYTVTDAALLTAECTYTVWIKNLVLPQFAVTCRTGNEQNITVPADPNVCEANVTVLSPIIDNPCNEVYSITNDFNNTDNASGIYPIGETTVTWTIIDASGKVYNCTQTITVEDTQPPVFTTCPGDYEQQIIDNGCDLDNVNVPQPVYTDNCPNPVLTYELIYPDLTIATGTGSVTGMTFPVGVTTVNYTVTDGALLTDVCSFTVWVKNLADPPFQVACPANVNVPADEYVCEAVVTVPAPGITNPCNELYTVVNDSPYRTSDTDASGTYPIGSTTFDWTITDASGNVTVCPQTVTVTDLMPRLTCPDDIVVQADFELPYKDVVDVDPPVYSDNCPNPVLNWSMVDPSGNTTTGTGDPSGINIFPSPSRFNIGVSTITYELIDMYNNRVECSFTVTVLGEPVIECQLPIIHDTDPGTCTYTTNPGSPTLVSGALPITWTWTITDPDGNTQASGSMVGSVGNPGPPDIGDQTFELGTSIITWTACNVSGCDECTQEITVEDHEKPTFSSAPYTNCVDNLFLAAYVSSNLVINPDPDYHTFKAGTTVLDLTNLADNCCDPLTESTIHWRIDFTDVPDPANQPGGITSHLPISGTGQPSTYGSDILLWGDGVNFTSIVHTITYWVEDCHGNISAEQTQAITITPRPQIN